jgi:hypothetical protein
MAVKRVVKKEKEITSTIEPQVNNIETLEAPKPVNKIRKWIVLGVVIVGGLVLFWYKTNTWPVVASVDGRIITRYEVDKSLYAQGAPSAVDEIITQSLIENELKKNNIDISSQEMDAKVAEIRKTLGTAATLEDTLKSRNITMKDFLKQLKLQMAVQKALEPKISITTEEITAYINDYGASMTSTAEADMKVEAEDALKMRKLQEEVVKWIDELRTKAKIWYMDKNLKIPEQSLGQ